MGGKQDWAGEVTKQGCSLSWSHGALQDGLPPERALTVIKTGPSWHCVHQLLTVENLGWGHIHQSRQLSRGSMSAVSS